MPYFLYVALLLFNAGISLVDRKGNVPKLELFFLVSNAVVFAGGKCNCITKTSGEAILDWRESSSTNLPLDPELPAIQIKYVFFSWDS